VFVIEEILKFFPNLKPRFVKPRSFPEIKESLLSSKKIYVDLGWKAEVGFYEGLRRCIDWWKNQK